MTTTKWLKKSITLSIEGDQFKVNMGEKKCVSVTLFVSLPLKNFKTILKSCVSGIQAIYLTYMWPEKHWNISSGLDRN